MKFLIILVLLVALAGAAFFTRPSQASFQDYYAAQATAGRTGVLAASGLDKTLAAQYAKDTFTYNDHVLWVDVSKGGQVVFTGALGHWFVRDAALAKPPV